MSESRILFDLYKETKEEKYSKAIELTYSQILTHPRTKEGNFWHKEIYPNQVWLDGLSKYDKKLVRNDRGSLRLFWRRNDSTHHRSLSYNSFRYDHNASMYCSWNHYVYAFA